MTKRGWPLDNITLVACVRFNVKGKYSPPPLHEHGNEAKADASLILVEEEQDTVLTGTSDCLSNCLHTVYKVLTD